VSKVFRAKELPLLTSQLELFFDMVTICKPRSSRDSSIEAFVVCVGYKCPDGYTPSMDDTATIANGSEAVSGDSNIKIARFLACGDLSGWDSDMTYPQHNETLEPVQPPIDPPYKTYFDNLSLKP
jgi:tRNA (cytidine32/guanosine34-2'-O)-methyltransferase